ITLHPNLMYAYSIGDIFFWLEDARLNPPIWVDLAGYHFSLYPHISPKLFSLSVQEGAEVEYIDGSVRLRQQQIVLREILRWCFDYPDQTKGAPEGAQRRQYLKDFRERMDSLDYYPGELKQLWESIKAEYA